MRIGLFLPHVGVFGGVRRYIELGNQWAAGGHAVTLYHPSGAAPAWLPFAGETVALDRSREGESDLAIAGAPETLPFLLAHRARTRVYYCVIENDPGVRAVGRDVLLMANSGPLRAWLARTTGRAILDGAGGIDTARFRPDASRRASAPLRVLVNGRRSRSKKGTDLVLRALAALRGVPEFEIVLFDTIDPDTNRQDPRAGAPLPPNARYVLGASQDELAALYQSSHIFVAAERKAGWCNTAIEALASGCALVCTRSGTTDFARDGVNARITWRHPWFLQRAIRSVLADPSLREKLAAAGPASAATWSWTELARRILGQLP